MILRQRQTSTVALAIAWMLTYGLASNRLRADHPQWTGRQSCAASTCHGGVSGRGPAWNSSLSTWEATDAYHVNAGKLLDNSASRDIAIRLLGQSDDQSDRINSAVRQLLVDRCVSCHAPIDATETGQNDSSTTTLLPDDQPISKEDLQWRQRVFEGVGCEACHGPASLWVDSHTESDWKSTSLEAKEAGMIATENWIDRTIHCTKCHIGSRSEDSEVRDMNHDMIAAGHPALNFDMSRFQYQLAPHWAIRRRGPEKQDHELPTLREHDAAKALTVSLAAKLALERTAAAKKNPEIPRPEFSEYDCFHCHQSIRLNVAKNLRNPIERSKELIDRPTWLAFQTSNLPTRYEAKAELAEIGMNTLNQAIARKIEEDFGQRAMQRMRDEEDTPLQTLAEMERLNFPAELDGNWNDVATWSWSNRLGLLNLVIDKATPGTEEVRQSLARMAATLRQIEISLSSSPIRNSLPPVTGNRPNLPSDYRQVSKLFETYTRQLKETQELMQQIAGKPGGDL